MASKGGKHRSKKSSSKRSSSFKKTTGGTSFKNYSKKQKNLDYKYRIMDITDTNQQAWYVECKDAAKRIKEQLQTTFLGKHQVYNKDAFVSALDTFVKDCVDSEATIINTACHFIPVSTSQLVAKNMTVEVRSRYPFAYCLFQNTKQFRDVFLRYMTGTIENLKSDAAWEALRKAFVAIDGKTLDDTQAFWDLYNQLMQPIFCNPFGLTDSGFVVSMLKTDCSDYDQIADNASPTSAMWGQICRAQSSYREIRTANNAGEYFANINAYYSKASTYLTTSNGKYGFTRGYTVGSLVAEEEALDRNQFLPIQLAPPPRSTVSAVPAYNTFSNISTNVRTTNYDTIFNQGDMILCILPTWFLNTVNPQAVGQQSRPSLDISNIMTSLIPSVTIVRHYYILNQDVGIKEVEKNYTQAAYNIIVNDSQLATVLGSNDMGNTLSVSQMLVRNIVNQSAGVRVSPLTRMDVDDLAQKTNCIVVDENCYDSDNQELELQAYMDLQPVPANAGNELFNDVEGGDTMNCNAIVSCGNDTDTEKCFDATVSNTGPQLYTAANTEFELYNESSTYSYSNIGYGYAQLSTYQTYISQSTTNISPSYHTLMGDGSQFYHVDFDRIEAYVKMINQFVDFRCIIPKFTASDSGGKFSFESSSPNYHDFGFQPTGSSNKTYLLAILPFGFSHEDTSEDYYMEYLEPVLCVVADGESATNVIEITPSGYEVLQQFYSKEFISTSASNTTMGKYSLSQVCGLKYDDTTDPAYSPQDGEYIHTDNIYQYAIQWMDIHQSINNAGKVWKKIKGFFSKVVKFIRDRVCPVIKSVSDTVAPYVPAPYGTVVSAVGSEVSMIQSALNLIAAKKNNNTTSTAAVQDDTVADKFYVTPQYRLSDSDVPADIAQASSEWVDGDVIEVDATQYGNSVMGARIYKLSDHPRYLEIKNRLLGTRLQGLDVGAYCQQRIKVVFRKANVSPAIAKGYKAILALGSDTQYLKDSDYQVVDSNQQIQEQGQ